MPRIEITLPEQFSFATEIPVTLNQINYRQHLDNAALLGLVSETQARFFASLGYAGLEVEGLGIVVADVAAQYRSEAFHGEIMVIEMAANDFNKYGCDLPWRMRDKASGREVARGKHGIVFFDYTTRKLAAVPAAFVAKAGAA